MYGWHCSSCVRSPSDGRTSRRYLNASALFLKVLHLALAALLSGVVCFFCLVVLIESNTCSSCRLYALLDFKVAQVLHTMLLHDLRGIQGVFIKVIPTVTPGVGWPSAISVIIIEERLWFRAVLPRSHLAGWLLLICYHKPVPILDRFAVGKVSDSTNLLLVDWT